MKSLKIYRVCLVLLLVVVLAGGIWYCYQSFESQKVPEDGTLVQEMIWRG